MLVKQKSDLKGSRNKWNANEEPELVKFLEKVQFRSSKNSRVLPLMIELVLERISFSRLNFGNHGFKIETCKWNAVLVVQIVIK